MSKKYKNRINIEKSKELLEQAFGFEVEIMNYYQFRIRSEETERFWDWYHTTGSLVDNNNGSCRKVNGEFLNADILSEYILRFIAQNI